VQPRLSIVDLPVVSQPNGDVLVQQCRIIRRSFQISGLSEYTPWPWPNELLSRYGRKCGGDFPVTQNQRRR